MELDHGAAIVTGAAGGIGSTVARALVARGMAVVLSDIDGERLETVATALADEVPGVTLTTVQGDVGDPAHHSGLVAAAAGFGVPLRLSVLNAGVSARGLSWEMPIERWEQTTRVNYWGVVHGLRSALTEMVPADDGWVVAVSSGAGLVATPGLAPYVATKHAVVGLMESTHHELARIDSRVGVSVICPGNIATDMPLRNPSGAAEGPHARTVEHLESVIRSGVDGGAPPETVSEALVEGVEADRFWILPQPELGWAVTDRAHRIANGDDPADLLG
ncbi:MAG: SDR family NAD(P)-dependent oxidoreductase [Microthrixaceae bacterium]